MFNSIRTGGILTGVTVAMALTVSAQSIFRVDPQAPGPTHDGESWPTAYLDLQHALNDPNIAPGKEIWVAEGVYRPTLLFGGTTARHATFHIPAGVKILGGFIGYSLANPTGELIKSQRNPEANLTVLDGDLNGDDPTGPHEPNNPAYADNAYHVVYFFDAPGETRTKLSGFVIQGGHADNPKFFDWIDRTGGGIVIVDDPNHAIRSSPLLDRLVIRRNFAQDGGGGVYSAAKPWFHLANCIFDENTVGNGFGGAIAAEEPAFGGLQFFAQNCVFSNNRCLAGQGGAAAGRAEFVNCTFVENACTGDGGALVGPGLSAPVTAAKNCIVWDNSLPQLSRIDAFYSDVEDQSWWPTNTTNFALDPLFRFPEDGDFRLRNCSPCVEAGSTPYVLEDFTDVNDDGDFEQTIPWDSKKLDRIIDAVVDMGAFELLPCQGDVDGDAANNLTDLAILLTCFGLGDCDGVAGCCRADLDCDDDVDVTDLALLLANYGVNCREGPGGLAPGGGDSMTTGDDPLTEWLRTATPQQVLDWWNAGMPPIDGSQR